MHENDELDKAYKAFRRCFNAFLIALVVLAIGITVAVIQEIMR